MRWRSQQSPPTPLRCDNPACVFHSEPLQWNGKALPLVLDHINGNNSDNRPTNLQLLCPNCESQLETRGGRNKGRIEKAEGGFAVVSKTGHRDYILPAEGGEYIITGSDIGMSVSQPDNTEP